MEHEEGGGGHDSSERWLVSYADFITLLFALFVLMYAMSMQSSDQVNRAWTAAATGVGVRPHRGGTRPELGEAARASGSAMTEMTRRMMAETSRKGLANLGDNLSTALLTFQDSGVSVRLDNRGLVISLSAARFFASGDAEINPVQLPVLAAVAKELSGKPNPLEIDGFTPKNHSPASVRRSSRAATSDQSRGWRAHYQPRTRTRRPPLPAVAPSIG